MLGTNNLDRSQIAKVRFAIVFLVIFFVVTSKSKNNFVKNNQNQVEVSSVEKSVNNQKMIINKQEIQNHKTYKVGMYVNVVEDAYAYFSQDTSDASVIIMQGDELKILSVDDSETWIQVKSNGINVWVQSHKIEIVK